MWALSINPAQLFLTSAPNLGALLNRFLECSERVCAGVGGAEPLFCLLLLLVVENLHCMGYTLEGFFFFFVRDHPQIPCPGKMRVDAAGF